MRRIAAIALQCLVLLAIGLPAARAATVTWDGSSSANWGTAANWTPAGIPAAGDDVIIVPNGAVVGGFTVVRQPTLNVASNNLNTLVIQGGATLTMGAVALNVNNAGAASTISGAGTLAVVTGTVNATGNITVTTLTATTGTINAAAAFTPTTFTAGTSTVNYNGAGNQTISAFTYNNLNTSIGGTKTLGGTVTVNAVLTVGASSTLDLSTQTLNLAGAGAPLVITGTFTPSTSTVNYTGAAAQTITATTYATLGFSGAGVKTNSGTVTVNTALTGTAMTNAATGILNIAGTSTITTLTANVAGNVVNYTGAGAQTVNATTYATLNFSGAGVKTNSGTVTVNTALTGTALTNTGTLNIAGTSTITTLIATANPNTVSYTGGAAQTVKATTYDTLNFSGAGVKTNSGTVTVNTALTGTALTNTGTLNIAGTSPITTLTATAGGNIVNYTGAGQTIKATSYDTLNVTGTAANSGTVTVAAALGGAGTLTNAATGTLNIGGTSGITGLTATAAGNIVNYTGAAAQTVNATTYDTLNFSGAGVKTNSGTVTVQAALTGTALTNAATGILNIGGTSGITTLTATAGGNIVNYTGAGQTVKATSYDTLNVTGTATNSGTVTVAAALGGAGTLTQGAASVLNLGGTIGITTLDAATNANTVVYTGAGQTVKATTYSTLNVTGTAQNTGTVTVNVALGGVGGTLTNAANATLNIAGTSTITGLTATANPNTVNYSGAAQTVKPVAYYTLTLSGSGAKTMTSVTTIGGNLNVSGTATMTGNAGFTVTGALNYSTTGATTLTAATAISVGTYNQTAGTLTDNANTITVTGTGANAWSKTGTFTATGTVIFSGAAPQIGASNFNRLTINSGTAATLTGAISVASVFSISGSLDDGGNQITGNAGNTFTVASGGSLTLGSAGTATTFPTLFTGTNTTLTGSTVTYASGQPQNVATTSTQTINYGNLTFSGAGTKTTLTAAGTLRVQGNWDASSTTRLDTNNTIVNLTGDLSGTGSITQGTGLITGAGSWLNTGTFTASSAGVTLTGTSKSITGSSSGITFTTLTVNPGASYTNNNTNGTTGITVSTSLTGTGTLTQGASTFLTLSGTSTITTLTATASPNTVTYNGGAAQTIKATTYHHLTVNNAAGTTLPAAAGAIAVNGNLAISAGTLSDNGFQITGNGTGTFTMASGTGLTLGIAGTATPFPTAFTSGNTTLNSASTVTYASGVAQTVSSTPTYGNLTFSGAGTKTTASGTLTVAGDWAVGSTTNLTANSTSVTLTGASKQVSGASGGLTFGTLTVNPGASYTNNCTGTVTVNTALSGSGTLTQGANALLTLKGTAGISTLTATASPNTVTYNGSASQAAKPTTYHHLTINNSTGTTLAGDATVNGTLTLTSGNITAGANNVIIATGGTVSRTSGHVIGNLRKNAALGATSLTYEVGDASAYAPATIAFGNVSVTGNLTVAATAGPHPDAVNSGIDPTQGGNPQSVNRYWTATNSGITFTNYAATLNYLASELSGTIDLTTVGIAKADSCDGSLLNCTWTYPTIAGGTGGTTSTQATGLTSFSHFEVGKKVDHFVFTAIPDPQLANNAFSVTITAVDKNGTTVAGFTGTANIASPGFTLPSGGGTTSSFVNGVYSGSATVSNATTSTLTATQTGNAAVTGTSNSFTVNAQITSFNAFETSTAAGAVSGKIFTKLASTAFSLDVVAINAGAQQSGFTGTQAKVKVELVINNTPGSNYGANNCPNAEAVGSPILVNASQQITTGRSTVSFPAVTSAYRDVRVRISYPTSSSTNITCSNDSFSVRPQSFAVTSATATQTGTSGAPAIKAGANFSLTATAIAGYDGTPNIDNTKVVGSPNAGTIGGTFGAAPSATGIATGSTFTYSEVGNFGLNADAVVDTGFTSLDGASDCVSGSTSNVASSGKYGCSIGSAAIAQSTGATGFGRFIPDNFNVTFNAPAFGAACGTFGYVGQVFTYGTAPVMTVTARNSSNATTANYAGAYVKLTNSSLTPGTQGARYSVFDALGGGATPSLDTTGLPATTADPAIGSFTNGVATLTFSAGTGLAFARSTTTPNAPFNTDIALALNVIDGDAVAYASNPAAFGVAGSGTGIPFTGGNSMRFGRLRILGATGVSTQSLVVPIRTEYWTGTGFTLNTLDGCTTLARGNFVQDSYAKSLNACETIVTAATISFAGGKATLKLSAPSAGNEGSVNLTPQLGTTASGNFCNSAGGSETAATAAIKSYLQGAWTGTTYDKNPSARASFGTYGAQPKSYIFFRENY